MWCEKFLYWRISAKNLYLPPDLEKSKEAEAKKEEEKRLAEATKVKEASLQEKMDSLQVFREKKLCSGSYEDLSGAVLWTRIQ